MPRLILFVFILIFAACENGPKPVVVTYQLTHKADTTFTKQYKDSIQIKMDSFCINNYEELYNNARDSLLREELAKIEKLMYDK